MTTKRLSFDTLSNQPRHFQSFTGFATEEFLHLVETIKEDWELQHAIKRKTDRTRKIGGGRKLDLPDLKDRLLVFLIYAKVYPTQLFLEYLFGVDESNICRIIQEFQTILSATIIIDKNRKRIHSLEELRELIPDLDEVIVDATEQKIPRPAKKRTRKKYHSGKKKAFTMKTQILVKGKRSGLILHASDSSPGRVHDYKLFKKTEVPRWLENNPNIEGLGDSGFQGVNSDYPDASFLIPVKRSRSKKELSRLEKIFNTKQRKRRVVVEHTISKLKKFRILAEVYRNVKEQYSATFKSVAFLANFRMIERGVT